ncbi:MAG: 4Fe-4S binding protein [Hyphomicrobiaceae bacterium]|nr:4Fe-4S binding protein [Hyphomicrobiaceae bacterium]
MKIDGAALARQLGRDGDITVHTQLCRRQIAAVEAVFDAGEPVTICCTQEAPLFSELAGERDCDDVTFVNIRETAGWTTDQASSLPKMAALIAAQTHRDKPAAAITINSEGQCLVYGPGQVALDAATALASRMSVTLLLSDPGDALPASVGTVPIHRGRIRRATGSLGRFSITIDGFAAAKPSSRAALAFDVPQDNVTSTCDVILDLSTGTPLFSHAVSRDGYVRAEAGSPAAVAKAVLDVSDLVGEFEKPLYVGYDETICAHSRSTKVGCSKCLDNCPTGAITPDGDIVRVDPGICGGCGACSAVCPTGAISYAYPERADVVGRIARLAKAYLAAGGQRPVLLIHEDHHGGELLSLLARYGAGLPANVLPMPTFSVFQMGHEIMAAALVAGFDRVVVLAPPGKAHDFPALESQVGLANAVVDALGFGGDRVRMLVGEDPDAVGSELSAMPEASSIGARMFAAVGGKRDIARSAFAALAAAQEAAPDVIPLPKGAPYGRIIVDADNCTLCLACVGACPAGALSDDAEHPRLRFAEQACVQCGLCVNTCPERVIRLEPRYNFASTALEPVTMKEEEPHHCISCGKAFGTKSSIEKIVKALEGRHAMFQNKAQIDIIRMCDNCRVIAVSNAGGDPFTLGERPRVRTTEDYISGAADVDDDDEPKRS